MIFTALKDNHRLLANGEGAKERYYEKLLGWSQKLFAETSKLIEVDPSTTAEEYVRYVSNRWEGIGLIFSVVGQGAMLERDWKTVSQLADAAPADQRSLGILAATAGDTCLQFCDDSGVVHDPLGWLLYQHIHLLTFVYGNNGAKSASRPVELVRYADRQRLSSVAKIGPFVQCGIYSRAEPVQTQRAHALLSGGAP
jgi:chromatin structure-remodeling complex subunit RSC3/30